MECKELQASVVFQLFSPVLKREEMSRNLASIRIRRKCMVAVVVGSQMQDDEVGNKNVVPKG